MVPIHPRVADLAAALPLGIGDRQLRDEWKAAREATGIDCRWHDLRHTCASWLAQAGVTLHTIAQFLGHSSVAVTQRYAHLLCLST
jgi:integrase